MKVDDEGEHFSSIHDRHMRSEEYRTLEQKIGWTKQTAWTWINWHRKITVVLQCQRNVQDTITCGHPLNFRTKVVLFPRGHDVLSRKRFEISGKPAKERSIKGNKLQNTVHYIKFLASET